jgi:hypothetical protein
MTRRLITMTVTILPFGALPIAASCSKVPI